jgi:hypothetical protein
MAQKKADRALIPIERLIIMCRGTKVILDETLAGIYGVTTKRLNEQVKRNSARFPEDFCFQITREELGSIRSQFATAVKRNVRYTPYAFTEHGAIMAANVLNSPRAVQMSVFVVRAFIKMRTALGDTRDLARKLAKLEKELKDRLGVHESAIVDVLQRIMSIIDPPPEPEPPPKRRIACPLRAPQIGRRGFGVEEPKVKYGSSRRRR